MLVLHGLLSSEGALLLWAEDADRPVTSRSQAMRSARPHPFAATADQLAAMLPGRPAEVTLRLPSLAKSPLDSPEMIRLAPRQARRVEPALLPWTVAAVGLDPAEGLAWLTDPDRHLDDIRLGASIGFLGEVALFATDLVRTGRLVPALSRGELAGDAEQARAHWLPLLRGREVPVIHGLVTAMPPVCRAAEGGEGGEQDPHELLTAALSAWVDARARADLAGVDLAPARRGRRPRRLPGVESWLAALSAPEGWFAAPSEELDAVEAALAEWIEAPPAGPARATFRLSEVSEAEREDAETTWRLEFLLRSAVDPSLLVTADQIWNDDGSLGRWLDRPDELLLGELGRASSLYPVLAEGLRRARPTGLELDAEGVVEFLTQVAPRLDEAGFGVLLPTWWDRRSRLSLKLSAQTPTDPAAAAGGRFGQDQLCGFNWQLAVGDETLTEAEIAALAQAKAPLVRLRGEWVAIDPDQIRRGLDFLEREGTGTMRVGEVLSLAAGLDDGQQPIEVAGVEADGWLGDLLAGRPPAELQLLEPAADFAASLRPYQQRGLSWLGFLSSIGLGACLADDMGLGKTVQLLALETHERGQRTRPPTLLLCPMSLVGNWQREAARFAPGLRVYAHHGTERRHGEELRALLSETDLVVTTYGTAIRDADELAAVSWGRVVLDEAQAVKNSLSRAARTVRRLDAEHRVALTGTPVENRLSELWSIMEFLNPGLLGSREVFRTKFAIPVERYGDTRKAGRLREITRPYVLRRLKTDPGIIDDLPEKIEIKQYCRLTVEQASLYQAVVDDMMTKIEASEGIERRGQVLAAMAKLKQVCNHPAQLLHDRSAVGARSGKINRLEEILAEILAEGDRVLCFTQFTEFAELLIPHLAARFGTDIAYLHGGTSKRQRDELVRRFQAGEGPSIFLLSLKAGGTGLTLTAANHVIHLDRWWNPAVEDQATDRAFRIGQKRNVAVHKFICTGTLEERIDDMIEEKKALAELVVSDGEGWLTELSTRDLRSLFALSREAVDDE
ncbi:DEAD/DEAH box helicase [Nocardioides sp.]|uniref:DEAD/DEAH box helicase n=1 Tax=Nocardioides sp. TaxID=35761 RepID=UPI0039E64910